jgi:uncharacterized membrane protein affecting hemolysin expression
MSTETMDHKKYIYHASISLLIIIAVISVILAVLLRSKAEDIKTSTPPAATASTQLEDQTTADVLESGNFKAEVKINPSIAPEQ